MEGLNMCFAMKLNIDLSNSISLRNHNMQNSCEILKIDNKHITLYRLSNLALT